MNPPKRTRGRILTPDGLRKLCDRIREREIEANAGGKYTLERLGEITGLDPETVKNVLDRKGSDKRTIARLFETFELMLEARDYAAMVKDHPTSFIGRETAIADLNALVRQGVKVVVIQARGGVGKTTLALRYLTTQGFDRVLELWMAKETQNLTSVESVVEEWLQRHFQEEAGREFGVTLERLRQKLRDASNRIGVLIDNLEPALDQAGKFVPAHRRYVELLRVLADPLVKSVTLITSRERLREVDITLQHYLLKGLSPVTWQQFFDCHQIQPDPCALKALHAIYDGNAKAMEILCSVIQTDFTGSLTAYWQTQQNESFVERDLEDLVITQFNRLQQLDCNAYNLLCRLGCYRYQDVATVDIQGLLCLLWDVPTAQRRRVVTALQDRSLVDWQQQSFLLHPVIRAVAIARLRASTDWETANRQAAEFWTAGIDRIETIEHTLQAFEAYHHYVQLNDFEAAATVILRKRNERLGRSFYQFGLFQQIIPAIALLIENLNGYQLSGLYNLLGISHRIIGEMYQAIEYHKKAKEIADRCLKFQDFNDTNQFIFLKRQGNEALINIGLCQIQLWELEAALETFTEVEGQATEDWKPFIFVFLAFLNSCLDMKQEANRWIIRSEESEPPIFLYRIMFLGKTYANLGQTEKAFEVYQDVITIAEKVNHRQTLAMTMSNLAMLYREEKNFDIALLNHNNAIEILDKVGAKYDLAESYYQLGLTYQAMGKTEQSQFNLHKAIQLFSDMAAPKQEERVKKSLSRYDA